MLASHIATLKDVKPGPRKNAAVGLRGNGGDLGICFELVPNRKTDSNCGGELGDRARRRGAKRALCAVARTASRREANLGKPLACACAGQVGSVE